jgi:hypothetical protein
MVGSSGSGLVAYVCLIHVSGIFCREGPFTENEKNQANSAIIRYKVVSGSSMRRNTLLTTR